MVGMGASHKAMSTIFRIGFLMFLILMQLAGAEKFRATEVATILKNRAKMDGKAVELHGRLVLGPETSIFTDGSICQGADVSGCSVWVDFGACIFANGE